MMKRWFAALSAALLCLGVALSAGWLWQTLADVKYEASARLRRPGNALVGDAVDNSGDSDRLQADESQILSPEVLSAAVTLLQERGVSLALPSPFDPVADYLVAHTQVSQPEHGQPGEIDIRCAADEPEEALQILKAIVDAYVANAINESAAVVVDADDVAQVELQVEREQLSLAVERQQQSIAEMTRSLEAAINDASVPAPAEAELERVRQSHREVAKRLAEARRDFDDKLPPETVAARIADVPTRNRVLERLNLSKVRIELQRQEKLQQKWSAVYGRNHPRMVEIREKIETLEEQLADFPLDQPGQAGQVAPSSPAAIVLAAFESESTELEQTEQKLVTQLGGVQERFQEQQTLELQLGEARQELAFLHGELERTQKQLVETRREHPERQPSVIVPPALDRESIGSRAGLPMAVSCVAGMALYLLLLWQIRGRWLAADRESEPRQDPPPAAPRRERFRSQEEEQLMRLKLATRG